MRPITSGPYTLYLNIIEFSAIGSLSTLLFQRHSGSS